MMKRCICVVAALCVALAGGVAMADFSEGLLAYYEFEDTLDATVGEFDGKRSGTIRFRLTPASSDKQSSWITCPVSMSTSPARRTNSHFLTRKCRCRFGSALIRSTPVGRR